MSKKNSNVLILKNSFDQYKRIFEIYSLFKEKLKFVKKKFLVAAISGGPDSLALAALLKALEYEKKIKVFYVIVDHGIRKNSSNEARKVKSLLLNYNISLKILKNKKIIKNNVQNKAREVRYNLLKDFCKKKKISLILTGHHRDDQVETFLIRLSRGSGVQGLSSMSPVTNISKNVKIIRPLLDLKKEDLTYISKKVFGKFFKDPSNKNKKYLRVKVRGLKKFLEKKGIKYDQILKSIKNLGSTRDTLNIYISKVHSKNVSLQKNKVIINFRNLLEETPEIQLKVIGNTIRDFTNSYYPPRSKKIMNLISQIKNGKKQKLYLAGCNFYMCDNNLEIKK